MLKILLLASFLFAAASATPAVSQRWQIFTKKANSEASNGDRRIVGGEETDITIIPHQVAIFRYDYFWCGGSILNTNTILTAAHCTYRWLPSSFKILAGYTNRENGAHTRIQVSEIRQHEDYDDDFKYNDIAILKLEEHLVFDHRIRAINLPPADYKIPENRILTVSGWGDLSFGVIDNPLILRSVPVPAWSNAACDAIYSPYNILDQQICAGEVGRDSCYGDSGGPLTEFVGESRALLVGLVSWGEGCAGEYPGIYARVSYYLDWITSHM